MRFEDRIALLLRVQFFWHLTLSLWMEFPKFWWHYEPPKRQQLPTQWHNVAYQRLWVLGLFGSMMTNFFFINIYFVYVVLFCVWKQCSSKHVGAFIPKGIVFFLVPHLTLSQIINKIERDATVCRCLFAAKLLYLFRVSIAPIIRSTSKCNCSFWYRSYHVSEEQPSASVA